MSHTFVVLSSTTASPACKLAMAHARNFAMLIRRGDRTHSCCAFMPPASTYSLWMSSAMYRSICLVPSVPFMLHSLCLCLGRGFLGLSGSYRFGFGIFGLPRLVSAGVQLTQRALDFFHRNRSHSGCRTTQTLTPLQPPCGRIASRIRRCHAPGKFILITRTVGLLNKV